MDLYYERHGKGQPIVMIHSPGVDSREWQELTAILQTSYQVITFDARGVGRSPAPYQPLNLVEDLRLLLEHLNIKHAVLVGHSMGGQIATDFTLQYPGVVDGLMLIAPSLTGFVYSTQFIEWMNKVNSAAPDIDKLVELSLKGPNYSVVMSSRQRDFLIEMQTQYMKKVFNEWACFEVVWPKPPAIERLEEIAAKTMFIQGTVEWPDMRKVASQFQRVPDIRFVEFEGADHMIPLTHSKELGECIRNFLSGQEEKKS